MANIKVTKVTFGGQNLVCDGYTTLPVGFSTLEIEYDWALNICPGDIFSQPVYIKITKFPEGQISSSKVFNDSIGCWGPDSSGHLTVSGLAIHEVPTGFFLTISTDQTFSNPQMEQYVCKWTNDINYVPQEPEPIIPIVPIEPIIPPIVPLFPTEEKGTNIGLIAGAVAIGLLFLLLLARKKKA